jgi:hypothetical protein
MRKIELILATVLIGLQAGLLPAATIDEILTIESPATINPGNVVVVHATLEQTPSSPTATISSWSPDITVQTSPATVPQTVHFLYTSSYFTLMTKSTNVTSTLLQATLVPHTGNSVPVNEAGFSFSFIAPAAGRYTLVDSGTFPTSTPFVVGAVVPEPASLSLLASGALAIAAFGVRRFRRRSVSP